ncbi:MAG: hypothetical protein MJY44_01870 [Bacteroidales bacterium]|nr:hypothetical protein [Bacteroidales bacterium]
MNFNPNGKVAAAFVLAVTMYCPFVSAQEPVETVPVPDSADILQPAGEAVVEPQACVFGIGSLAVPNPPVHPQYGVYRGVDSIETALYNLAVDEMVQDIEDDGTFRTGKLWGGVWTRDVSYSIIHSLAHLEPAVARTSLMKKVDRLGRIVQDTGTGGAWPCSIDRQIWTVAAYELWLETGDREWLENIYDICSRSMRDDFHTAFNPESGLFAGESSFIDWRTQSYPAWMDSRDICRSECLGTNAVFVGALKCLSSMASELGKKEAAADYSAKAAALSEAINSNLWLEDRGFYAQYRYGRNFNAVSPRSETLGEALCIMFGVADADKARRIVANMPLSEYGPTIFWPQIKGQKPYHNNGVWPFVTSYYALAAALVGSSSGVEAAMRSNASFAAKYGTNYENMVSADGTTATCINSPRQLWSVAGFISPYLRLMLGINYTPEGIRFNPFIPASLKGERSLEGMKYRNMTLDVRVNGSGGRIESFLLDGEVCAEPVVPCGLKGRHSVEIVVAEAADVADVPVKVLPYVEDIPVPEAVIEEGRLKWTAVEGAESYSVFFNGKEAASGLPSLSYPVSASGEYSVMAVRGDGVESFMSEPVRKYDDESVFEIEAGLGRAPGVQLSIPFEVSRPGLYAFDWLYSNGNGEIETQNKCAVRSLYLDGIYCGPVVLPQRGVDNWTERGWSNSLKARVTGGAHKLEIRYPEENVNMNIDIDTARVHRLRLTRISK